MTDATTNLVLGSAVIIGVGSVVEEQMPNMKLIFAGAVVAIGLSVLDNAQPELATGFAAIIFIGLAAKYLPTTIDKLGFGGGAAGANIQPQNNTASTGGSPTGPTGPSSAFHPFASQMVPATTTTPQTGQATITTISNGTTGATGSNASPFTINIPIPQINVGGITL